LPRTIAPGGRQLKNARNSHHDLPTTAGNDQRYPDGDLCVLELVGAIVMMGINRP
jgi:hypothetical protein